MTGKARFAKGRLAGRAFQHPLRRLDMHALDHLIAEAFGAPMECSHEGFSALDLGGTRSERPVTGANLVGVDQALAVEAERRALRALPRQAFDFPQECTSDPPSSRDTSDEHPLELSFAVRSHDERATPFGQLWTDRLPQRACSRGCTGRWYTLDTELFSRVSDSMRSRS